MEEVKRTQDGQYNSLWGGQHNREMMGEVDAEPCLKVGQSAGWVQKRIPSCKCIKERKQGADD